jgi:hypothetical protein
VSESRIGADDRFRVKPTPDQSWTETAWFAAAVHDRGIGVWTYPLFRPEVGIMSCGVYVWGPGADEAWQIPYYRSWWHVPLPADVDPTDSTFPTGLSYECVESLKEYRITYSDGQELALDLTYRALHPPHYVGVESGHGHLDQFGRVTGTLQLHGERHEIDCIDMRDRTWGPRRESRQQMRLTYSYGATDSGSAFLVTTKFDPRTGQPTLLTGFLLSDQGEEPLTEASCDVARDPEGRPTHVELHWLDDAGETVEVKGVVSSRCVFPPNPWFGWACLVEWTFPDGTIAHGEHQDCWSPAMLREYRRQVLGR